MKRTLLITMDFQPMHGGVAVYWGNLCRQLPSTDLVVLAPECENSQKFDAQQKYVVYRRKLLTSRPWMWPTWLPFLFATWRIVRKEHIKRIIVTQVLPGGTVAYVLKKILRVPYVVSFHGLDIAMAQNHPRRRVLLQRVLRNAEAFIVNSESTKRALAQCTGSVGKPVVIVYPCPNIQQPSTIPLNCTHLSLFDDMQERRVLLTVGRLITRKGHDMVLRALPRVIAAFPEVLYVIVGRGQNREVLESLVTELHLSKHVAFYDDLLDEDLPCMYQQCEVFIMPARELENGDIEGFGIVYLEANAFGKPVIAGRSGGAVEAVEDGVTGLVVDPVNVEDIAAAIVKLFATPDMGRSMGETGRLRVQEQFTWEKQGKVLVAMLGK